MAANNTTLQLVQHVIEKMSIELGYSHLRRTNAETALFGGADGIDSLSLVRIVAEVEAAAEEQFGQRVVLADERAMSRRNSPFRDVGALAALLDERIAELTPVAQPAPQTVQPIQSARHRTA